MSMLSTLNLYAIRVGNTGSFFAAAVDVTQAKAVGEQWRDERGLTGCDVTAKRYRDSRPVFTFAK